MSQILSRPVTSAVFHRCPRQHKVPLEFVPAEVETSRFMLELAKVVHALQVIRVLWSVFRDYRTDLINRCLIGTAQHAADVRQIL